MCQYLALFNCLFRKRIRCPAVIPEDAASASRHLYDFDQWVWPKYSASVIFLPSHTQVELLTRWDCCRYVPQHVGCYLLSYHPQRTVVLTLTV